MITLILFNSLNELIIGSAYSKYLLVTTPYIIELLSKYLINDFIPSKSFEPFVRFNLYSDKNSSLYFLKLISSLSILKKVFINFAVPSDI